MVCPIADITLDNSLTGSDSDVGDLRRQVENSCMTVHRNKDDIGNAEYYKRGNQYYKSCVEIKDLLI